jgi:hypothetical protein
MPVCWRQRPRWLSLLSLSLSEGRDGGGPPLLSLLGGHVDQLGQGVLALSSGLPAGLLTVDLPAITAPTDREGLLAPATVDDLDGFHVPAPLGPGHGGQPPSGMRHPGLSLRVPADDRRVRGQARTLHLPARVRRSH